MRWAGCILAITKQNRHSPEALTLAMQEVRCSGQATGMHPPASAALAQGHMLWPDS